MLARYAHSSHKWRGSQVVRSRSAKPLFAGSIPAPASQSRAVLVDNVILFPPSGSIDSLAPARSPANLAGLTVYVGAPVPPPFRPRLFLVARTELEIKGENTPVTQATACVSRLIQSLPRRCSRRLLSRMLDRIVSCHDRFSAKWRCGFRRKERS